MDRPTDQSEERRVRRREGVNGLPDIEHTSISTGGCIGKMWSPRRIRVAVPMRNICGVRCMQFSSDSGEAGRKFREYRSVKNLNEALTKSIKSTKKRIVNDPEKARLDELTSTIESRGFEIDNETCPKVLYLSKDSDNGENVLVSIWKEHRMLEVHAMIGKLSIESYSLTFRCACNKGKLGLYAVEVIPASAGDDHSKIYGSRPMPEIKNEVKMAMMKYLSALGIDSTVAAFAELYCRHKEKHKTWKFMKDFKDFAIGDVVPVNPGTPGSEDTSH